MEHITPPLLTAVRELRWRLLSGKATKDALREYVAAHNDDFSRQVLELSLVREQQAEGRDQVGFTNFYQLAFWDLVQRGLDGHPIVEALEGLEAEVAKVVVQDIDRHIQTLPFKALIPLMFLQFPAFVLLLIGPLLRELEL